ncbi:MAG: transposase [Treponema sp.]|jgi:hypothetical protein|nr:transposase [Treponema sp.]
MRHKAFFCLEQEKERHGVALSGILEADETYLLESLKGKTMPDGYWREARKHKAVSVKQGISDEYICVCAAVERGGKAYSRATGRGISCKEGILAAFLEKIKSGALMVCDGTKSYGVLEERQVCSTAATGPEGFHKINEANGYHRFIKERNQRARGFATKYLNRYNALFSQVFRGDALPTDEIFKMLADRSGRYRTISARELKTCPTSNVRRPSTLFHTNIYFLDSPILQNKSRSRVASLGIHDRQSISLYARMVPTADNNARRQMVLRLDNF